MSDVVIYQLTRILRAIAEPSPDTPLDVFVSQVTTEIWAMEKLRAAKRVGSLPDKGRRGIS